MTVVNNGDAAISALKTIKVDLLILDLIMPQQSGVDTLRAIRADDQYRDTCILALSGDPRALNMPEAELADKLVMKPIGVDRLIQVVNELLDVAVSD